MFLENQGVKAVNNMNEYAVEIEKWLIMQPKFDDNSQV